MPEPVDWSRYRKCMHCFAVIGRPCTVKTETTIVDGKPAHVVVEKPEPHRGRKRRTGQ